jgi:hypothetical protein
MCTAKNLLDTDMGGSDGAKAALSKKHLARVKRDQTRRLAGGAPAVEQGGGRSHGRHGPEALGRHGDALNVIPGADSP